MPLNRGIWSLIVGIEGMYRIDAMPGLSGLLKHNPYNA